MSGFSEIVTEVVRNQDGEVESFKRREFTRKTKKAASPAYTVMLSDNVDQLIKLPAGELKLLLKLGQLTDYSGHVDMSQYIRQKICKDLKISNKTLYNQLGALKKSGFIREDQFSKIEISPLFFFKGKISQLGQRQTDFREKRLKKIA